MILYRVNINATDYIRKPGNSIANQYGKININGRPQATPRYIFSVRLYLPQSEKYTLVAFTLLWLLLSCENYILFYRYQHMMKICSVVFHEMRHLYKKRAVEIYPRTPELRKQRPKKMRILCPKFYSARSLAICRIASCFSGDSLRYHVSSSTSLGFVMVF